MVPSFEARQHKARKVLYALSEEILLGVFFNMHSSVLIHDVPITEKDFEDEHPPENIYRLYEQVSYNCFIAAAMYLALGAFSWWQIRLRNREKYVIS
ncbi:ribonuclease kappa isoform X2 [Lissotriton helveticus]